MPCNLYEKACKKMYFEVYKRNGILLRKAEQFPSGNWVVWCSPSSQVKIAGEYTNKEFHKIRKYF